MPPTAMGRRGLRARASAALRTPKLKLSLPLVHLYFVWALTLLDLQFFLSEVIAAPLALIVHLAYPPLLISLALQAPILMTESKPSTWYPPFLLFFLIAVATTPFAANYGYARIVFIYLLLYYSTAVATGIYVKSARQALPIILLLALQFLWYGMFANVQGVVPWHPTLSNHDGFGSFSVMGVGMCYWFGVGSKEKKWKYLFYALALYSVLGVVASYARAAFLSLVTLGGWIWVRSPRKGMTLLAGLAAFIAIMIGASMFFDAGFFWAEMASAFTEGKDEGTGGERWKLWMAAIEVWKVRPILGVGGGNFGAFASGYFPPGALEGFENPGVLYGFNLHNAYFQVLSEFGTVGVIAITWIFMDFFKKNRSLRTDAARRNWAVGTGGKFDLYYISLALEAANLANMLAGMFYASLFMPWFWTVWAANRMLWSVTKDGTAAPAPAGRGPPPGRAGRFNRGLRR